MAIVLTGATGFVGSHLLVRMLAQGHQVIALVRTDVDAGRRKLLRAAAATDLGLRPGDAENIELVRVDLADPLLGLSGREYTALADRMHALWHCAGNIDLTAGSQTLHQTNVIGTGNVLNLAGVRPQPPTIVHISTAFVAGGRLDGHIAEDDLDDRYGFLTAYEQSKYHGEQVVRAWARDHERPVTILRPSILLSDRPAPPGAPRHTHAIVAARLSLMARAAATPDRPGADTDITLTVPYRPRAANNILQMEYAADAMMRLGAAHHGARPRLVTTHHVVHPHNTPVSAVFDAAHAMHPWLRINYLPGSEDAQPPSPELQHVTGGVASYGVVRRTYARPDLAATGLADPAPIDHEFLTATFTPAPLHRRVLTSLSFAGR